MSAGSTSGFSQELGIKMYIKIPVKANEPA